MTLEHPMRNLLSTNVDTPGMPVRLESLPIPAFGTSRISPNVPDEVHIGRMERMRARLESAGLTHLVVFADREHAANMHYFTRYDPRFEDAMFILWKDGAVLAVGNEGLGYAKACPPGIDIVLFQDFSLMGQWRGQSDPLGTILTNTGMDKASKVGAVGWKSYGDPNLLDIPEYIGTLLRDTAGEVWNAVDHLIGLEDGLRTSFEVEQLAVYEHNSTWNSEQIRRVLDGVEPGMTEKEALALAGLDGVPMNCHPMLSSGKSTEVALVSPSSNVIAEGDPFIVAFGVEGTLNARAGYMVDSLEKLPRKDYLDVVVGPYLEGVRAWYGSIGVGKKAGEVQAAVDAIIDPSPIRLTLNAGHLTGYDEWVHSPFVKGSDVTLRSGMAIQCDLIPEGPEGYWCTNVEDTIALADEDLRQEFASRYPAAWDRIQKRRAFLSQILGVVIDSSVLPFSNIPGVIRPLILARDLIAVLDQ